MPSRLGNMALPPLPAGKSIIDVFADFLGYLTKCAEEFIKNAHPTLSST